MKFASTPQEHGNAYVIPGRGEDTWNNIITEIRVKLLSESEQNSCAHWKKQKRKEKRKKKQKAKHSKSIRLTKSSELKSNQINSVATKQNASLKSKSGQQLQFKGYNASSTNVESNDDTTKAVQTPNSLNVKNLSSIALKHSNVTFKTVDHENGKRNLQTEQVAAPHTNDRQKRDVTDEPREPNLFQTDFTSFGEQFQELPDDFTSTETDLCIPQSQDEVYLKISGDLNLHFNTRFRTSQETLSSRGR